MQGELRQVADLALFAKIVQTGGISRCAADLGMERTTISRRLGTLEKTLGVKLLDRSPKHISVTDAGRRCLEQCEQLLESARNAQSLATIGSIIASATPIVVGAPPDIIDRYLEPQLSLFESENPGISIERRPLSLWTEEAIDSVDLGVTLAPVAITGGWTNTIAYVRQSVFASKDYAENHAPILTPFDLDAHDCIVERSNSDKHAWRFDRGGDTTTVSINSRHVVSSLLEAREATLAGLGICLLPQYLCEPYLRSGHLVDLMPDTDSSGREVVVISPRQRQRKSGTAALRLHLEAAFKKETI
ncbi:MAG: LysR family transcriptional regulator [Gammaproteobacteria bacterium]|nr:LysR family transcriptional regulator [Gammaproteobacteria bacterium]